MLATFLLSASMSLSFCRVWTPALLLVTPVTHWHMWCGDRWRPSCPSKLPSDRRQHIAAQHPASDQHNFQAWIFSFLSVTLSRFLRFFFSLIFWFLRSHYRYHFLLFLFFLPNDFPPNLHFWKSEKKIYICRKYAITLIIRCMRYSLYLVLHT